MLKPHHNTYALLFGCALLLFFRLGSAEIQPWDEGLYAMRAVSMLTFDAWWDQVQYAIGGLYSATYPPLLSWMQALSMSLFGGTPFAIRLFPALCGGISVFLLYGIAKRCMSKELSVLSAIVLTGSVTWVEFARLGMTDVPLVMAWLWSAFCLVRLVESRSTKLRVLYGTGLALAVAMSLLLKITISIVPIVFIAITLWYNRTNPSKPWIVLAGVFGLVLAAPWYVYMAQEYGDVFTQALFVPHVANAVENTPSQPWWFYVNQLIVSHPMMIVASVWLWFVIKKHIQISLNRQPFILVLFAVWFFGGLLVLSAASTKHIHYTVLMIPAACVLALHGYEVLLDELSGTRRTLAALVTVVLATVWTLVPGLRDAMKAAIVQGSIDPVVFIPVVVLLVGIVVLLLSREKREIATVQASLWLVYLIPGCMLLHAVNIERNSGKEHNDGGDSVGALLLNSADTHFTYVYHERNKADAWNPQLAWYTHGWLTGWLPGKHVTALPLPETIDELVGGNPIDVELLEASSPVVYYTSPIIPEERLYVTALLSQNRSVVLETNRYTVFSAVESE